MTRCTNTGRYNTMGGARKEQSSVPRRVVKRITQDEPDRSRTLPSWHAAETDVGFTVSANAATPGPTFTLELPAHTPLDPAEEERWNSTMV